MLLLSGVFKPSGPEREKDHRRSMANLSRFHRPSLILLICLPFVEAHSRLPEFRIRPCFVTKTAQVIMLNGWTKEWMMDEAVGKFVCMIFRDKLRKYFTQTLLYFRVKLDTINLVLSNEFLVCIRSLDTGRLIKCH